MCQTNRISPSYKAMASKPELDMTGDNDVKQSGIGHMTRRLVTTGKDVILTTNTRKLFYNLLTALLTLGLILSVSVFTYGSFYFAYSGREAAEGFHDNIHTPRFMRKMLIFSLLLVCPAQDFVVSQIPR